MDFGASIEREGDGWAVRFAPDAAAGGFRTAALALDARDFACACVEIARRAAGRPAQPSGTVHDTAISALLHGSAWLRAPSPPGWEPDAEKVGRALRTAAARAPEGSCERAAAEAAAACLAGGDGAAAALAMAEAALARSAASATRVSADPAGAAVSVRAPGGAEELKRPVPPGAAALYAAAGRAALDAFAGLAAGR
jgi:hypothetical protein